MGITEKKFQVLEENVQVLEQATYKILAALRDLKQVLTQKNLLVHPEEKGDIPKHSLFAQVRLSLEKEEFESAEEVHTEPAKDCKVCNRNQDQFLKNRRGCTGDYYGAL